MTVGVVVLAAVYATLSSSLRAWKRAEALGEEAQTARATLDLVSRDLRAAVWVTRPIENIADTGPGVEGTGQEADERGDVRLSYLRFLGQDESAEGGADGVEADRVEFTALDTTLSGLDTTPPGAGDVGGDPPGGLVKVRYWLDASGGLARSVSRAWGDGLEASGPATGVSAIAAGSAATADSVVISALVRSLGFRYFDGTEWLDSWDSNITGRLPYQVEITVKVGPPDSPDLWKTYRTVTVLPTAGVNGNE